jgi:hypothetical protein
VEGGGPLGDHVGSLVGRFQLAGGVLVEHGAGGHAGCLLRLGRVAASLPGQLVVLVLTGRAFVGLKDEHVAGGRADAHHDLKRLVAKPEGAVDDLDDHPVSTSAPGRIDADHGVFSRTRPGEHSRLRGNRFPELNAYRQHRELAEQAHQLASQVGLRQAAKQLGIHRDALKAAFRRWGLPPLERRVGWQPSPFLADRAEAGRAFRLAERLGSVNAAAAQLGTTWPSLRKAFQRHGLGMPARNPEAVRQRAVEAARQRSGWPATPSLDPVFVALNHGELLALLGTERVDLVPVEHHRERWTSRSTTQRRGGVGPAQRDRALHENAATMGRWDEVVDGVR